MNVYLDTSCYNRPFDDQSQDRIRLRVKRLKVFWNDVKAANGYYFLLKSRKPNWEQTPIARSEHGPHCLCRMKELF